MGADHSIHSTHHIDAGDDSVYQTTWCHIQDDYNKHIHCCKNLKYHFNDIWYRVLNNDAPDLSHKCSGKQLGFKALTLSVQYTQFLANSQPRWTNTTFWLDI
jgi:hypothetical protein